MLFKFSLTISSLLALATAHTLPPDSFTTIQADGVNITAYFPIPVTTRYLSLDQTLPQCKFYKLKFEEIFRGGAIGAVNLEAEGTKGLFRLFLANDNSQPDQGFDYSGKVITYKSNSTNYQFVKCNRKVDDKFTGDLLMLAVDPAVDPTCTKVDIVSKVNP